MTKKLFLPILIVAFFLTSTTLAICDDYKYIVLEEQNDYRSWSMGGDYPKIIVATILHSLDEVQKYAKAGLTVYRISEKNLVKLSQEDREELIIKKVWVAEDPKEDKNGLEEKINPTI